MIAQERVFTITATGTSNAISPDVDIVLCKAASGTTNVQLPKPAWGMRFTLIKTVSGGSMVIAPVSGLINGASSFTMTGVANDYATFKAIGANYHRVG